MLFGTVFFLGWADQFMNKDYESQGALFATQSVKVFITKGWSCGHLILRKMLGHD